jgi:5'-methylthioadenosine phosphorylase
MTSAQADIAVIGGSGFYSLLDDPQEREVDTPYGPPSAPVSIGALAGRRVAFLPRHGVDHRFAPHLVPYRANLWALRSVGARQVVALSAVGSLRADQGPGTMVVPDQLVDRTWGRPQTYADDAHGVVHVPFSDPYCPVGRQAALAGAQGGGLAVVDGGTLVVVNGPRFSTRAESQEFQRNGWSIIGMTGMPEATLARELALCYTSLALVTDLDAGVEAGEGVTHASVLEQFAANLPRLRELLLATVGGLPDRPGDCECAHVYDGVTPAFQLP